MAHRVRVYTRSKYRSAVSEFLASRALSPAVEFDYSEACLAELGAPTDSSAREVRGDDGVPYFDVAEYGAELRTETLGRTLLYAQTLNSTQTLVKDALWGLDAQWGALAVAERQVKGTGRGSNAWSSPPGCLMFTFHSQFTSGRSLPFVQYMISVAMLQAIESTTPTAGASAGSAKRLPIYIKWPNDIYADLGAVGGGDAECDSSERAASAECAAGAGRGAAGMVKIAGILCNSSSMHAGRFDVVTGVGLNVWNDEPTTSLRAIVELANAQAAVSVLLCTVTFHANLAHSLTRSP